MDEVRSIVKETTPEDGVIKLEYWPEGYVLWYHGEIVWKSWEKRAITVNIHADMKPLIGIVHRAIREHEIRHR